MNDGKPTGQEQPDDSHLEPRSAAELEQEGALLTQAALSGLEDLAAGRVLSDAELDSALSVKAASQKNAG